MIGTIMVGADAWVLCGAVAFEDEIYFILKRDDKHAVWKSTKARPVRGDEREKVFNMFEHEREMETVALIVEYEEMKANENDDERTPKFVD